MAMKKCPACGVSVKLENLERHTKKLHPGEEIDVKSLLTKEEATQQRVKPSSRPGRGRGYVWLAALTVVIVVAVVLVAFTRPSSTGPSNATGLRVGQLAPDFTLPTASGHVTLSNYRGKPVLLEFMDVDCHYCQDEAGQVLSSLYTTYAQQVHFLSLDVNFIGPQDDFARIEAFQNTYDTHWTYALDTDGRVNAAYGVDSTPHTFVLDKNGIVVEVFVGRASGGYASYQVALEEALAP